MKIYCAHATSFDYKNEWYGLLEVLRERGYTLIFPHQTDEFINSKELIAGGVDVVLAEVSYPSTGLGMELAWAQASGVPIVLAHRVAVTPSRSLQVLKARSFSYESAADLVARVSEALASL